MPGLVRIYNLSVSEGENAKEEAALTRRERRLLAALSILASLDVTVVCGLSTFYILLKLG